MFSYMNFSYNCGLGSDPRIFIYGNRRILFHTDSLIFNRYHRVFKPMIMVSYKYKGSNINIIIYSDFIRARNLEMMCYPDITSYHYFGSLCNTEKNRRRGNRHIPSYIHSLFLYTKFTGGVTCILL